MASLDHLVKLKKLWGVSVAALTYRLHTVGGPTEGAQALGNTRVKLGFNDSERASVALKNISGNRLTYRRIDA